MQTVGIYTGDRMDERTALICHSRDRLRAKMLKQVTAPKRRGLVRRVMDAIELAWAYAWALTFGMVWVEIGERLGLWERIDDEEAG